MVHEFHDTLHSGSLLLLGVVTDFGRSLPSLGSGCLALLLSEHFQLGTQLFDLFLIQFGPHVLLANFREQLHVLLLVRELGLGVVVQLHF